MNFSNLIFVGDIHGDLNQITYHQKYYKVKNSLYIQLGDYGIGFKHVLDEKKTLNYYNNIFEVKNNHILALRGNHDDKSYFNGKFDTNNIALVEDYTIKQITHNDTVYNILFLGGAISIDRITRKAYIENNMNGRDYWFDENFVFNEELLNSFTDIDIVVSHTAPNICKPYLYNDEFVYDFSLYQFLFKYGYNEVNVEHFIKQEREKVKQDIIKEREMLTNAFTILKKKNNIKYWLYGHFHTNEVDFIDNTKFVCVDKNDFYTLR